MLWSGLRRRRFLRPALAGPALGGLSLLAILALLQRPGPLFVNLGVGDEAFARGFRAWERDGLRASGETMFRWALDGARVDLPVRVVSGSLTARLRLARFTDRPADITLLSSGRAIDEWTQPPRGWRERTVELGEVRGAPTLQFRTRPEDPEALGIALDWVELRGAGRVLPAPNLFAGLLALFLGVPLALSLLAGPAPAVGAAGAAAAIGAALVTWDRLGGLCALGAAGLPALVAAALVAAIFRLLARRWPDTLAGAGELALVVPAAALALARLLGLGPRAGLLAQTLAAFLPVMSSRLALALFPTLLGQALELVLIVHLMRRYPHLEGARDAAAACAFFFAAQAAYTGSMLNVGAVVIVFAGWELAAGDRHKARRVLGAWAIAAAGVVRRQYARFVPVVWREVLPHLGGGSASMGDEAGSLAGRAARRAATFYDVVYPLLLGPGLLALRGAPRAPRRVIASVLLAGAGLLALRYAIPVVFRDAKEVELLAAPVAVAASAGIVWTTGRGRFGRLAAAAAAGIALAWGAQRAVAVYLERFVAVGR